VFVSMSDAPLDTLRMRRCIQRWQVGDPAAADELLRGIGRRLEHLTRKVLRTFPAVRGWAETADVLQGSLLRLLNTLRRIQPKSTRHFFNLAALHIRRELLDLARRFRGERFARPTSDDPAGDSDSSGLSQVLDATAQDADLDLWCRFHEGVDQLPAEEREVMGLVFYHSWTQAQIADLFQVDERTVRRRWQSACLRLNRLVGEELPQP
jgi:RNA polymerase sigma-70 factor (ECF subfamily)